MAKAFSGVFKALGLIKKPKPPPAPLASISRDDIRDRATQEDELRRRRGGAADMVTGAAGAEAGPGGRTQLG